MKKNGNLLAGLFLFVILMVSGTSYAVDLNVPTPYPTIQSAIDAAQVGDTVFVAAGTYNENITMKSGINVVGNSPADTIIVGQTINPNPNFIWAAVRFDGIDCAVLKNFTITQSPISDGLRSVEFVGSTNSSAVLQNCILYGNGATGYYGIFILDPAKPSIINNTIVGKSVGEQGIYIGNCQTNTFIANNIITGFTLFGIHVFNDPVNSCDTSPSTAPSVMYNDVVSNGANYSGLSDPTGTGGNISADPMFVDSGNGNYHLYASFAVAPPVLSPCIGAGYPNGEFQNSDGGFDMGAFGGGGNSLLDLSKFGAGSGAVTSSGGTWLDFYPLTAIPNVQLDCPSSCDGFVPYPDPCASCSSYYTAGSLIALTASPETGSSFAGWSGCGCAGTAPTCDKRYFAGYVPVQATFAINTYTVTPSAMGGGLISPSNPQTVNYNGITSFTVTPNAGYHIVDVTGCGGQLSGNTYVTGPITADCVVEASFAINTYTVTPMVVSGVGSLSPSVPQTVNYNETASFTVTPYSAAWYISSVTGCGGSLSGNSYETGPVTADCTVTATFSPCEYSASPGTFTFDDSGGTGSFILTTNNPSCAWVLTFPSWIGVNGYDGQGSDPIGFTVIANISGTPRSGSIEIKPTMTDPTAASVTINQDGCTFAINPYKAVLPASGGTGYTVSVIASNNACEWQAQSNDPGWMPITLLGPGPLPGSGTVTYMAEANNTGAKRTGTMTIAGLTFIVDQNDNSLQENLVVPTSGTWVTATITNDSGQTLVAAKPTCCNTYFWVTDASGNMVPPKDRVCEPVGIPDSLVSILPGSSFEITCDLSEVAQLPQGTVKVMATYVNPLTFDPHYDGAGGCLTNDIGRTECFNLKPVVIPSGVAQMTIGSDASAQKTLAALAFNPQQWDMQWAAVNGPAISAQISTTGITCSNVDLASIKLNGQAGIVSGSCMNMAGGITVKFDRSAAVQSLGTLVLGTTADVTIQGSFAAGTDIFYGQGSVGIVKDTGTLVIQADMHTVGSGSKPSSVKAPLIGMKTRVFDKKAGNCAAGFGMSWQNYASIWGQCTPEAAITTNSFGQAIFALSPGDYLVIGMYGNIYSGVSVGVVDAGSIVDKYLQIIQTAAGQILPAKYQKFTGSELLVIEPEYVEWDGTQELYPFIFQSLGDWAVTTAVTPPEGFVADQPSISVNVYTTLKAVQFTVTDVGSKWVPTKVKHKIKHNGKTTYFYSKVGLKLSARLQKKLGLGEFGEKE